MKYSWHKEFYDNAMKKISKTAGAKLDLFHDWYGEPDPEQSQGWLSYFEQYHPEAYRKYQIAMQKINTLWGNKGAQEKEDWKAAVKIEIEATQWAVDRYIEHMKKILSGDAQPSLMTAGEKQLVA